jgi:hypothetical protein
MARQLVTLFVLVYVVTCSIVPRSLIHQAAEDLQHIETFYKRSKSIHAGNLRDMTVECGVCGIVVNEIQGFVAENLTLEEIESVLDKQVCSLFGGALTTICDELVSKIPQLVSSIEAKETVSVICVNLGYCTAPFTPYPDPQPVPVYTVNLDLPPNQRLQKICSNPQYINVTNYLVNTAKSLLHNNGLYLDELGQWLNRYYFPQEYAQEIQGCATALGISYGWVTLMNLGYEVSDACTSIVAQTLDGKILHARNLDFWDGMGFTDSLKDICYQAEYTKGGKLQYHASTFAGYVGVLSGMRPNAFSVTIDTRFYSQGIGQLFYEIIAAITERNASLVSFLSRTALENGDSFETALSNLSNDELIADVYYIMAGSKPGEGAVISRNRMNATDVWRLNAPSRWFEVETNYDHWKQPPWFDDRVVPANNAMNGIGRANITLQNMFDKVLSIKPVLNLQSTLSMLACPATGFYSTHTRWCPYPCVE